MQLTATPSTGVLTATPSTGVLTATPSTGVLAATPSTGVQGLCEREARSTCWRPKYDLPVRVRMKGGVRRSVSVKR